MAVTVLAPKGALSRRVMKSSAGLVVDDVGDRETTEPSDEQRRSRHQDGHAAGAAHPSSR